MKNLFIKYRLNHNQKLEANDMIKELLLINTSFAVNELEKFAPKSKQIANEFIALLRELRYPEYSLYRNKLSSLLAAIHNDNHYFRIIYNDNFEGDEYQIDYLVSPNNETRKKIEEKKVLLDQLSSLIKGNLLC